jgi:hypothetical protein
MRKKQSMPPVLRDHRRHGKTLIPPLADLPIDNFDWEGVWLPEHLWLAHLLKDRSLVDASRLFASVCDALDPYYVGEDESATFVGYMSDFHHIKDEGRQAFARLMNESHDFGLAFDGVFRSSMGIYAVGPSAWIADGLTDDRDIVAGLSYIGELVKMLRLSKSQLATHCRILGFGRLLKHRRIFFSSEVMTDELSDILSRYPQTNPEESLRVEQLIRTAMMQFGSMRKLTNWSEQFWKTNLATAECR